MIQILQSLYENGCVSFFVLNPKKIPERSPSEEFKFRQSIFARKASTCWKNLRTEKIQSFLQQNLSLITSKPDAITSVNYLNPSNHFLCDLKFGIEKLLPKDSDNLSVVRGSRVVLIEDAEGYNTFEYGSERASFIQIQ